MRLGWKFLPILLIPLIVSSNGLAQQRLAVYTDSAHIRSGPGTNHAIIWKAEKYYPLLIVGKRGRWYRVEDFEGDIGWVYRTLVKKLHSVITKKSMCNIRSGPGTKYRIVFKAEKGVSFRVLKSRGKWLRIQHRDGDIGWIHKSLTW